MDDTQENPTSLRDDDQGTTTQEGKENYTQEEWEEVGSLRKVKTKR
jgi:hypothetical protein